MRQEFVRFEGPQAISLRDPSFQEKVSPANRSPIPSNLRQQTYTAGAIRFSLSSRLFFSLYIWIELNKLNDNIISGPENMKQFLDHIELYLQSSLFLALAASYLGGILVSLTPCIYPMIPITVGAIGSANLNGSKSRGFLLSLTYVAGMSLTYTGLGLFAAVTGQFFGTLSTHPVTLIVIGNILLFFALNMLDVFSIPYIQTRGATKTKGLTGIFLLGLTSGIIAGPCTTPVLGSLLAYVASTGNLVQGGLMLFIFAFGMGTILLLAGTCTGILASVPKSGAWMGTAKKIIALLILILAEYFFVKAGTILF